MIDFYNAFISYRHADLDSKIAEHVQKQLEHFHVPHKLKKKLKHEKITRIFRDKDELPITSDLTETITNALEKAEYLIVICSTNTKESMWVKREIKTFLQTHTMDKVLTVLCNGEPYEVIPEELLTTTKEYVDETGMTHTVEVPIEPLSCDYRLPKSTADKEELPRLASALLGCSYDELQRRRRQYRIRRATSIIAAVFAVLIALGAYLGYTTKKINDSYMDSLRSRSKYLANEAEQLLAEGKRTDALQVALAALPNDSQKNMPVTAEAMYAITETTAAYESRMGITNYYALWNYKTAKPIKKTVLSGDEKYLAAHDEAGHVYCWNAQTNKLLFDRDCIQKPVDIIFMDEGQLLIVFSDHIESYHVESGDRVWEFQVESSSEIFAGKIIYANHSVYFDNGEGTVARLSGRDGSILDTYKVLEGGIFTYVRNLAVSPDGKLLGFVDDTTNYGTSTIYLYNTETGKEYSADIESTIVTKLVFAGNDHLFFMTDSGTLSSSTTYNNEITFIEVATMHFYCFDPTMKLLWTKDLQYNDMAVCMGVLDLPSRDSVMLYVGNAAVIANKNSGETTNEYRISSSIVTVADFNNNDLPEFICRHGELVFALNEETNRMYSYNVLGQNVSHGIIGDKIYSVESGGTDIICYFRYMEDDEWTGIDAYGGFTTGTDYQKFCDDGEYLVIASKITETTLIRVSVIDMDTAKLVFSEDVDTGESYLQHFDVQLVDGEFYGIFHNNIYSIDIKKEKVKDLGVELAATDEVTNGKIINAISVGGELTVNVWDLDGSNHIEFKPYILDDYSLIPGDPTYIECLDKVFIPVENSMLVADLKTSKIKEMDTPDNWFVKSIYSCYITISEDGSKVLFSDDNIIYVTDDSLKELYTIHCISTDRLGAIFKDNTLYVIADDYLMIYNADTGEQISKISITLFGTGIAELSFNDKAHELFIKTGDQINILDTETWTEITSIETVYCYHPGTDRFFVYAYQTSYECMPGYIKHYTLDDLIEKALRYLDGAEVPAELKDKYGI